MSMIIFSFLLISLRTVSDRFIKPYTSTSPLFNELPYEAEAQLFEDECLDLPDGALPECLKLTRPLEVTPAFLKSAPEKVLFYSFYNMPFDKQQVDAAEELQSRGWKYQPATMRWSRKESPPL